MGQKVDAHMKTCLITDPTKDAYCGEPATGTLYKLPTCLAHRNELQLNLLEDRLAKLTEQVETDREAILEAQIILAEANERPGMAQSLRERL